MKIKFWHDIGDYNHEYDAPTVYVTAERENESCKYMLENGWMPYGDKDDTWHQCRSSRIKNVSISKNRKSQLSRIKISEHGDYTKLKNLPHLWDIAAYSRGDYFDTYFDDKLWVRINFYEDQVLLSLMNKTRFRKHYGVLAHHYFMEKFKNDYEYLYITEFYPHLQYKCQLPNFEYWDGNNWIVFSKLSRFHFESNGKLIPLRGFMHGTERVINNYFEPKFHLFE